MTSPRGDPPPRRHADDGTTRLRGTRDTPVVADQAPARAPHGRDVRTRASRLPGVTVGPGRRGSIAAQTTHLLLPDDLGDAARTTGLAATDRDVLRAVSDWIRDFVVRPHQDLGRDGARRALHASALVTHPAAAGPPPAPGQQRLLGPSVDDRRTGRPCLNGRPPPACPPSGSTSTWRRVRCASTASPSTTSTRRPWAVPARATPPPRTTTSWCVVIAPPPAWRRRRGGPGPGPGPAGATTWAAYQSHRCCCGAVGRGRTDRVTRRRPAPGIPPAPRRGTGPGTPSGPPASPRGPAPRPSGPRRG